MPAARLTAARILQRPQVFTITVNFVNQPPNFAASDPVNENRGAATVANWASYIPGPGNNTAGECSWPTT